MGNEKCKLVYHGEPQYRFLYRLLEEFCSHNFLSISQSQSISEFEGLPCIRDLNQYSLHGPIGALLSAWHAYPEKAWLVLACDYPFANAAAIRKLVENRQPDWTGFYNVETDYFEPLFTIYEPVFLLQVEEEFRKGNQSLSAIINRKPRTALLPPEPANLMNINAFSEFENIQKFLSKKVTNETTTNHIR